MGASTPCSEWTVSALINHIVGGLHFFEAGVSGQAPTGGDTDFSSTDFLVAYDDAATRCVDAFRTDGVMEQTFTLPFGEMPGAALVGLATLDNFTHGWDLARATGQRTDLAPELAAQLLAAARQTIPPSFRAEHGGAFGFEREAPTGAGGADQLAAFLGREV
jgi:uncharacterized protein (TIGR03086 family)